MRLGGAVDDFKSPAQRVAAMRAIGYRAVCASYGAGVRVDAVAHLP